ncbi:MAG TPA: N-acetylmuramoyl-L-alanine amidase [Ignavibacteriaceae bacterium]|nr:N-acetylmuramoyl-L-alanine amidase [Ignavibacteriaceae bacterium]
MKKLAVNFKSIISVAFLFFVVYGCGTVSYFEVPPEFRSPDRKAELLKNYASYINGVIIFIDPGHGGNERGNKGFEEFESEADLNLIVSLYLRDFLTDAGAIVYMSRTNDKKVELKDRSILADSSGADIFLSIHHNAPGSIGDIWTDYTSTYYHSKENNYEYEPSERDLARYVQRDLAYAVRNSGGLGSFDGTYSDYIIYPDYGFSVLRETKIPSILVECVFSTNHFEAGRLEDDEFNKIEAWGIFRGLCRYFKAGVPRISYLNNKDSVNSGDLLTFLLSDSTGIDSNSIRMQFDSVDVHDYSFDESNNLLSYQVNKLACGFHSLRIIVANKNGNHSFPFHKKLFIIKNNQPVKI